jgi:hypothetical protein
VRHVGIIRRWVCVAAAAQSDGLVQQLGHGLVIGMVLALSTRLDEAIVLKLGQRLVGETLKTTKSGGAWGKSVCEFMQTLRGGGGKWNLLLLLERMKP